MTSPECPECLHFRGGEQSGSQFSGMTAWLPSGDENAYRMRLFGVDRTLVPLGQLRAFEEKAPLPDVGELARALFDREHWDEAEKIAERPSDSPESIGQIFHILDVMWDRISPSEEITAAFVRAGDLRAVIATRRNQQRK